MKLSYVIVTHNRRESLTRTLEILRRTTPLPRTEWETWVVDNGSTDGTLASVRRDFPEAWTVGLRRNQGVWARSHAFGRAQGRYVILLDDDSYPIGDAVTRSIAHLESNPRSAAVGGRVVHPDGSYEACAFPTIMLSGAVCLRRSVLPKIGPFAREFFRKAGEYDFSFRIWEAGYTVDRREDVVYRHDKSPAARSESLAHRMDLRNNLILAERYLPPELRRAYRDDWSQRYTALARHAGCGAAAARARWEAKWWRLRETIRGRRTLSPTTLEKIFGLSAQTDAIAGWAQINGIRRVVIADVGKNLYATYRGCIQAGLAVLAIADAHPAYAGMEYRGLKVLDDAGALALRPQGVVISNINPAQIDRIEQRVREKFGGAVLRFWDAAHAREALLAA